MHFGITFMVVLGLVGCGSLSSPDDAGEPLWLVSGRIDVQTETPQNPRVQVSWNPDYKDFLAHYEQAHPPTLPTVAQYLPIRDAPLRPGIGSYQVALHDLPPEESLMSKEDVASFFAEQHSLPADNLDDFTAQDVEEARRLLAQLPEGRLAQGAILFYDDLDQNGQLTFVDPCATAFEDDLLGVDQNYQLVYWDGAREAEHPLLGHMAMPGLSLVRLSISDGEPPEPRALNEADLVIAEPPEDTPRPLINMARAFVMCETISISFSSLEEGGFELHELEDVPSPATAGCEADAEDLVCTIDMFALLASAFDAAFEGPDNGTPNELPEDCPFLEGCPSLASLEDCPLPEDFPLPEDCPLPEPIPGSEPL